MSNSSTGYQQTFLFDCSRLGSEEYNGSTLGAKEPSRFTNKVSSGIKLDIGDQVSVHSAYISELGAGGDVIEFKGKSLGNQVEINYTEVDDQLWVDDSQITPTGFARQVNGNASHFVQLRDNEASIVISYYKNTNGENYNGLPRDWGDFIREAASSSLTAGSQLIWTENDGDTLGAQGLDRNASHYYPDDMYFKEVYIGGDSVPPGAGVLEERPYVRNDNSRFTIFCFDDIFWNKQYTADIVIEAYSQWMSTLDPSPALRNYIKFKQRVDLEIDKGYNAPSNVAAKFTDKLNAINNRFVPFDVSSFIQESTTLKAFPATNFSLNSRENASSYFGAGPQLGSNYGNASWLSYQTLDYLSGYAYVGFKRPEFIEIGRELNSYAGFYVEENPPAVDSDIKTNIPWTSANLIKLKNLFDVQHDLYPELIQRQVTRGTNDSLNAFYSGFGSNASDQFLFQSRFLHVDSSLRGGSPPLGSDNMNSSSAGALNFDASSMPIFFYFNNSCSDIIYDESASETLNNIGDQDSNLVYGFARRWEDINNDYYISFNTEQIGGIPTWYNRATMMGRRIGYDYHYTAYGNAAIQLTNGFAPCSYYGQETFGSGSHLAAGSDTGDDRYQNSIRQVYVGANAPLFNFDTVETRFTFSDLHSPEQIGNFWNAGRTQGSDTQFAPPVASQVGPVYHINKALQYNTWSTGMLPYPEIDVAGRTGSVKGGADYAAGFIPLSSNLEDGVIYDSHSGVTIEDFGFDEVNWQEGLWGILGFSYEQFQGTDNLQTRFTNLTTNVSGATTNALITSADTKELMSSVWGTNLFNQQVPTIMRYNYSGNWIRTGVTNASQSIHPSITVDQNSTEIKAQNLPRKQLRGYFLIKSDILSDANYFKESDPMPVFAVVDKYNSEGDFINYSGGGPMFTVTQPKQLTEICTSILDPDGTNAVVSDYSAVVYRVDKNISTDLLVSQQVLNQK